MTSSWRLLLWIFLSITCDSQSTTRDGKGLYYRHNSDDLNIDHIINLWNKSASDETTTQSWQTPSSVTKMQSSTVKPKEYEIKEKPLRPSKTANGFIERFNLCVKKHKYSTKSYPDQTVVVRCLKAELVHKLNDLITQPNDTISLFHGYLEFQKLQKPVKEQVDEALKNDVKTGVLHKKYSSRVSSKRPLESNDVPIQPLVPVLLKQPSVGQSQGDNYYESYQKMLKELVERKSGVNMTRDQREGKASRSTLEKSARFFESGRKLISEISNNLENGEEEVENFTEAIMDPSLVESINNFTRSYSLRLNFYPGVAARMKRNENSGVTFDLELDDPEEGTEEAVVEDDGGRGGKKKNKKKISKKTLKKLFPYLLIPFMIQAALLPIVLKFLLFVAIKALIAGKLALILVAFNAIRNASLKSDEDEYIERMSYDHYGYSKGEEYGAWVNRRSAAISEQSQLIPEPVERDEYVEPYEAHRPDNEPRLLQNVQNSR